MNCPKETKGLWASVFPNHPATSFERFVEQLQLFLEDRVGSLEPGKDADIAVWDRDLYSIPSDDLKNLKCELTLLRGKVVYHDAHSPVSGVPTN